MREVIDSKLEEGMMNPSNREVELHGGDLTMKVATIRGVLSYVR